jgi:hypothetical protein
MVAHIAFAMWLAPAALAQNVLAGRVLDDQSEEALAGARVFLLNRYGRTADYTVTDDAGRFRFERKDSGWYRLEATAVGYERAISAPLWMTQDRDSAVVEVRLSPHVVLMAPVEVVAMSGARTSPVLENMQFRRSHGFGYQITREAIEQRHPAQVSDMLAELPGVYAERRGTGASGRTIRMGRALPGVGGGECPVQIFLDGRLTTRGGPGGDVQVDDLVNPLDVEAIEVFRGLGSVPPEFLTPNARCGVIAIWTKRSLTERP